MARLKGKRAVITGGAMGIGAATARAFVDEGAQVMIVDLNEELGPNLATELGNNTRFHAMDVGDEDAWQALAASIRQSWDGLDILVNNAGIMKPGSVESVTAEVHHATMRVHVDGTLWGCKHMIPLMADSGGGSIINLASIASLRGAGHVVSYCAAKGAIESMTRAISDHCALKANGVRCNSIHPMGIETTLVSGFFRDLGFEGDAGGYSLTAPSHIANAAVFLASDESSYMSGQRMVIDNEINHMPGIDIDN